MVRSQIGWCEGFVRLPLVASSLAQKQDRGLALVPSSAVPRGVMVAQEILDLFVKVRVLARQPALGLEVVDFDQPNAG